MHFWKDSGLHPHLPLGCSHPGLALHPCVSTPDPEPPLGTPQTASGQPPPASFQHDPWIYSGGCALKKWQQARGCTSFVALTCLLSESTFPVTLCGWPARKVLSTACRSLTLAAHLRSHCHPWGAVTVGTPGPFYAVGPPVARETLILAVSHTPASPSEHGPSGQPMPPASRGCGALGGRAFLSTSWTCTSWLVTCPLGQRGKAELACTTWM